MPTAKKLPSGSYRCQVFAGYVIKDGKKKRVYESFTASTKRKAELLAAQWSEARSKRPENMTVREAIELYIKARTNVLSPSTIRSYSACLNRFDELGDKKIRTLTSPDVQMWISNMAAQLSPKSVKNTYGLLTSALKFAYPDMKLRCKLPSTRKPDYYLPPEEDFLKVLHEVEGTTLWIAMMLARYYSLRRSEICALHSDDLNGDVLTIRRAMVMDKDHQWIIKDSPKTYSSYRSLVIAEPLLSALRGINGRIMDCTPNALFNRFRRAVNAADVEPFNFHALRHMFATGAALEGIPDIYTAQMGGWRPGSGVLKSIYQNVRNSDYIKQMDILNRSMQHVLQHEDVPNPRNTDKIRVFRMSAVGLEPGEDENQEIQ